MHPEQDVVTVVARQTYKEPIAGAVLEAIKTLIAASRAEAGCLEYSAHVSPDDPRLVLFYERWSDQAAFEAHIATAHFERFVGGQADKFATEGDLGFWRKLV